MNKDAFYSYIADYLSLQGSFAYSAAFLDKVHTVLLSVLPSHTTAFVVASRLIDQLILMGTVRPACFTFSSSCPAHTNTALPVMKCISAH